MRIAILAFATTVMVLFSASASAVITVDDFESGPFDALISVVPAAGDQMDIEQSGLPVLGSWRQIGGYLADGTSSQVELITTPGDDGVVLEVAPGSDGRVLGGYWGGPRDPASSLNLDLLSMGLNAFEVDIPQVGGFSSVSMNLEVVDNSNNQSVANFIINGPGTYSIPFSSFEAAGIGDPPPADFSDVRIIGYIAFASNFRIGTPNELTISEIRIVPEPLTLAVISFGAFALLRRQPSKTPCRR